MEHHAQIVVHMVEQDLPLVQFGAVEAGEIVVGAEGPDVLTVSVDVHGQEVDAVGTGAGQVVDRADDALAAPAPPGRVAGGPVGGVGAEVVQPLGLALSVTELLAVAARAVEVLVGQQVLRAAGPALQEVGPTFGPPQVAGVGADQPPRFVRAGGGNEHRARSPPQWYGLPRRRCRRGGQVGTPGQRGLVPPASGQRRAEVDPPDAAAVRAGLRGVPVGGVVAGYGQGQAIVFKNDR